MLRERFLSLIKWMTTGLILLGILYNFILPFTPVWLDVAAWTTIGAAFLLAVLMGRTRRNDKDDTKS